eukprot:scaffold23973_cov323-Cylindrotheca_fusiformis.AAC.1
MTLRMTILCSSTVPVSLKLGRVVRLVMAKLRRILNSKMIKHPMVQRKLNFSRTTVTAVKRVSNKVLRLLPDRAEQSNRHES